MSASGAYVYVAHLLQLTAALARRLLAVLLLAVG